MKLFTHAKIAVTEGGFVGTFFVRTTPDHERSDTLITAGRTVTAMSSDLDTFMAIVRRHLAALAGDYDFSPERTEGGFLLEPPTKPRDLASRREDPPDEGEGAPA